MKQEKIFYLSCYALDKNIGREYNSRISELPDDAWVCLMDQDIIFLSPYMGARIAEVIQDNQEYDLIGCVTNRLRHTHQLHNGEFSEDSDIRNHIKIANDRWIKNKSKVIETNSIAGMFMLFRKSLWNKVKFFEKSIKFDTEFCAMVKNKGGKIGIANGLYVFHLYRMWTDKPLGEIKHLL